MVSLDFPRIRDYYNFLKNPNRYRPDDDEEVDLNNATDASTWRDQTKPSWKERLGSRKRQTAAFGFLGLVVVGLLAAYTNQFLPSLTGNIWLQRGLVVLVGVPTIFLLGMRSQRSKLQQIDWLLLIGPKQGVGFYLGRYDAEGEGTFQPIKGFDFAGLRGRKLELRDLDDDFAQTFSKMNRDPGDPAQIRLEDARYHVKETMMGRVVGVVTSGLKVDSFSKKTDLYTAPPDMADEETYRELTRTLQKTKNRVNDLEEQTNALREERDEWKQKATQRREEIEEEMTDLISKVSEAGVIQRPHRGQRGQSGRNRVDPIQNGRGDDS